DHATSLQRAGYLVRRTDNGDIVFDDTLVPNDLSCTADTSSQWTGCTTASQNSRKYLKEWLQGFGAGYQKKAKDLVQRLQQTSFNTHLLDQTDLGVSAGLPWGRNVCANAPVFPVFFWRHDGWPEGNVNRPALKHPFFFSDTVRADFTSNASYPIVAK